MKLTLDTTPREVMLLWVVFTVAVCCWACAAQLFWLGLRWWR